MVPGVRFRATVEGRRQQHRDPSSRRRRAAALRARASGPSRGGGGRPAYRSSRREGVGGRTLPRLPEQGEPDRGRVRWGRRGQIRRPRGSAPSRTSSEVPPDLAGALRRRPRRRAPRSTGSRSATAAAATARGTRRKAPGHPRRRIDGALRGPSAPARHRRTSTTARAWIAASGVPARSPHSGSCRASAHTHSSHLVRIIYSARRR